MFLRPKLQYTNSSPDKLQTTVVDLRKPVHEDDDRYDYDFTSVIERDISSINVKGGDERHSKGLENES
jgi:hypothetical protein